MKQKVWIVFLLAGICIVLSGCKEEPAPSSSPQAPSVSSLDPGDVSEPASSFAGTDGYLAAQEERYAAYRAKHGELTPQQVVTYVNIGLDREFYTDVETIADPDDLLVLCNKYHKLPDGYEPDDLVRISAAYSNNGKVLYLRKEAAEAFEELCSGAAAQQYTILGQSGYRSAAYQRQLYDNYAARDGQAAADTYSARPGYSEHQTGLAMDICNGSLSYTDFGRTAEYTWAKEHLHEYGFVFHYLPGAEPITGYMTEEWHIRYVGKETAAVIHEKGITLDEYCATYLQR